MLRSFLLAIMLLCLTQVYADGPQPKYTATPAVTQVQTSSKGVLDAPRYFTRSVMAKLDKLMEEHPTVFAEMFEKAKDETHNLFGDSHTLLQKMGFIDQEGRFHPMAKEVVLAAVRSENGEIILTDCFSQKNRDEL